MTNGKGALYPRVLPIHSVVFQLQLGSNTIGRPKTPPITRREFVFRQLHLARDRDYQPLLFGCDTSKQRQVDVADQERMMNAGTTKKRIREISPRFEARLAGCLYLLIILGGLFSPFAVAPSGMMVGDAALPTAAKTLDAKPLYIIGGVAQLMVYTCDIGVAVIFYELLNPGP